MAVLVFSQLDTILIHIFKYLVASNMLEFIDFWTGHCYMLFILYVLIFINEKNMVGPVSLKFMWYPGWITSIVCMEGFRGRMVSAWGMISVSTLEQCLHGTIMVLWKFQIWKFQCVLEVEAYQFFQYWKWRYFCLLYTSNNLKV